MPARAVDEYPLDLCITTLHLFEDFSIYNELQLISDYLLPSYNQVDGRIGFSNLYILRLVQALVKRLLRRIKSAQWRVTQASVLLPPTLGKGVPRPLHADLDPAPLPDEPVPDSKLSLYVSSLSLDLWVESADVWSPAIAVPEDAHVGVTITKLTFKSYTGSKTQMAYSWHTLRLHFREESEVEFLVVDRLNYSSGPPEVRYSVRSVHIRARDTMKVGRTLFEIMNQSKAYRVALMPIEKEISAYSTLPSYYIFDNIEVELEGKYKEKSLPQFFTTHFSNYRITVLPRRELGRTVEDLRLLDNTHHLMMTYSGVSGGEVAVQISTVRLLFAPSNVVFASLTDVALAGPAYLASVEDHRVRVFYSTSNLLYYPCIDSKGKLRPSMSFDGSDTDESDVDLHADAPICPLVSSVSVQVDRSDAPAKLYINGALKISDMSINTDPAAMAALGSLAAALQPCQLPSVQTGPPLPSMDSLRFWCHGALSADIQSFRLTHLIMDHASRAARLVSSVSALSVVCRQNLFDITGDSLAVGVDIWDDNDCIYSSSSFIDNPPPGYRKSPLGSVDPLFDPYHSASWRGGGNSSLPGSAAAEQAHDTEDVKMTAQLCLIPRLSFSLSHSCLLCSKVHDHHDVYLNWRETHRRSLDGTEPDKYQYFRSRPNSLYWRAQLHCDDSDVKPLTIWARLDVIQRLVEVFAKTTSVTSDDEYGRSADGDASYRMSRTLKGGRQHSTDASVTSPDDPALDDMSDAGSSVSEVPVQVPGVERGVSPPPTERTSLLALVQQLDLEIHMKRFVACSWASDTNFEGMVFIQKQLDFEMSLVRAEAGPSALAVDHLSAEIQDMDAYVRDWRVEVEPVDSFSESADDQSLLEEAPGSASQEPKSVADLMLLLAPIHKLGHASLVQATFLGPRDLRSPDDCSEEIPDNILARSRGRSQSHHSGNSLEASPGKSQFRPSVLRFLSSHVAFTPPVTALPPSYHSRHIPREILNRRCSSSSRGEPSEESAEEKFWGLCIVEIRFLWTVSIRDCMFAYGAKYVELFITQSSEEVRQMMMKAKKRREDTKREKTATMMDFLHKGEDNGESELEAEGGPGVGSEVAAALLNRPPDKSVAGGGDGGNQHGDIAAQTAKHGQPDAVSTAISMSRYFIIEFVDPQLNFLDERVQGSVVIVAGAAIVECKRSVDAFISTHCKSTDEAAARPQRLYDLRLRMDGVSLFTVPTNLEGSEPAVHWRNTAVPLASHLSLAKKHASQRSSLAQYALSIPERITHKLQKQTHNLIAAAHVGASAGDGANVVTRSSSSRSSLSDLLNGGVTSPSQDGFSSLLMDAGRRRESSARPIEVELLQLAVKDFQIRAAYWYHLDVTVSEAASMRLQHSDKDMSSGFSLNLPEICIELDSAQFFIVLHVVRNVLLSPPPPLVPAAKPPTTTADPASVPLDAALESSPRRRFWGRNGGTKGSDGTAGDGVGALKSPARRGVFGSRHRRAVKKATTTPAVDLSTRRGRSEMAVLIDQHLEAAKRALDWEGPGPADSSAKVLYDADAEKRRASGKDGRSAGSARTSRTVQYSVGRGQWLLKGLKSAEECIEVGFSGLMGTHCFLEDRSSTNLFEVQRFWARNQRSGTDKSNGREADMILSKAINDEENCRYCGQTFRVQDNTSSSCSVHANTDCELGEYRQSSADGVHRWSCCGNAWEGAPGCSTRTHMCRDIMLSVRADSNAPIELGGVDVIILKTLELSVFPSTRSELQVQVTRSLVDLLHTYFVLEGVSEAHREDEHAKMQLMGSVPSGSTLQRDQAWSGATSLSRSHLTKSSSRTPSDRDLAAPLPTASSARREGLFVKYLRVGEVTVKVSTAGFPIKNLHQYRAVVEPFVRHGKVLDWQRLVHKLERHAIWSLTKNTATNWFSSLLRGGRTGSRTIEEGDDEDRKHALLGT